jgi:hypothetical protein
MAAGLGFKDFVTGEVLTAADVDGYLMQGVWVFASAAARTSAVPSPQEGNMSFLKDTNSTEYYSGSAWVAVAGAAAAPGLTLVKTQTIGSAVSTVTVTNAFSATYDNYLILISGGTTSATAGVGFSMQLGSTTTGYYVAGFYNYANSATITGDSYNNTSSFVGVCNGTTTSTSAVITLTGPNLAKPTAAQYQSQRTETSDSIAARYMAFESSSTQHTDFTLSVTNSATATGGTIKVYGYANS